MIVVEKPTSLLQRVLLALLNLIPTNNDYLDTGMKVSNLCFGALTFGIVVKFIFLFFSFSEKKSLI